jgi:hypothetical protein
VTDRGHIGSLRAVVGGACVAVAVAVLAILVALPASGATGASPRAPKAGKVTWQQAAARLHAPVYRPRVTLGITPLTLAINSGGCLIGGWGSTHSNQGPHFSIDEPGVTPQCGQPGEAVQVSTVVIHSKKVPVLVQCPKLPHCTVHDGETDGVFIMFVPESGAPHYVIQLQSSHVSLHGFTRIARSFVRVRSSRAPATASAIHRFGDFLSPDGKVWCGAGPTTFCGTGGDPSAAPNGPQTLGSLAANGKVTICRVPHSSVSSVCLQNWDDMAPVLQIGQSTQRNNILCTSAANGISCVIATGPGKGRGFEVSATTVRRIGPSGPPPAAVPVLGDAHGGTAGFGKAHPRVIALGNDIIGQVHGITWRNWGATQADGTGTGYWIPAGKPASDARSAPAKVVAFDLGPCHGVRAYRKVEWWLPSRGGHFTARGANPACL